MTGELRLNGQKYTMHDLKQHAGYVMQDDLLNGNLTVLETLRYTAELRLPRTMSREERNERIQTVMQQMGLVKVQDVIIGSPLKKGVSGGERKRLCVAMELLTKPLLLFLDGALAARCSAAPARCSAAAAPAPAARCSLCSSAQRCMLALVTICADTCRTRNQNRADVRPRQRHRAVALPQAARAR